MPVLIACFVAKIVESSSKPVPEYKQVRMDSNTRQLETFGYSVQPKETENMVIDEPSIEVMKKPRVDVRLTSLISLRAKVRKEEISDITTIFQNHIFIGCVDNSLALIQYEQDIYLVNYNIARLG